MISIHEYMISTIVIKISFKSFDPFDFFLKTDYNFLVIVFNYNRNGCGCTIALSCEPTPGISIVKWVPVPNITGTVPEFTGKSTKIPVSKNRKMGTGIKNNRYGTAPVPGTKCSSLANSL
ncbi:hypothetical protein HanPSC8_Chr01g0025051 [Helianthus annuus]|nr:hypothetical protein HanPSC8_Chr01g0025051 [Helianthus annuus]